MKAQPLFLTLMPNHPGQGQPSLPSTFLDIFKPEKKARKSTVLISPPDRNERDSLSTEISGKESPRNFIHLNKGPCKMPGGKGNKKKKRKKPNPGSSLSAGISQHSWEHRASQTQSRGWEMHKAGGEQRQCKQERISTVTDDTQQINSSVTAFAIIIQTKTNTNDNPAQQKGGCQEGTAGTPPHSHLLLS